MAELLLGNNDFHMIFSEQINHIDISLNETRAYIQGVFTSYIYNNNDLSKKSITLEYIKAKEEYDFARFQNIADWILFVRTTYPKSINASPEYYDTIAQCSYYKCYTIMNKQWPCFEELADKFSYFANSIKLPLIR